MLQRDYIQRLIREFMAALERMLEKKEVEERREKIRELYNQYVGPYAFYSIATIEDVMKAMAGIEDEVRRRYAGYVGWSFYDARHQDRFQ
jgi:Zn-finger domain-containing protein